MLRPQALGAVGNASELPQEPPLAEKVYKVLVGIPLGGHTPPKSYHNRMLMWKNLGGQEAVDFYEKKNPRYIFSLGAVGNILTPFARERLCEAALASEVDYLFMVDDDMLVDPDIFYKLVKHDKDICAALAFTRNPDHKPVIFETVEGYDRSVGKSYGRTRFAVNYPRNQLVECDAVGFGAVVIKANVIRKMKESGQTWFFGMEQTGEDVSFCIKARKLGFSVWMDTSVKTGHLADPTVITEEYSDMWNKLTPEQREIQYGTYQKYPTEELG